MFYDGRPRQKESNMAANALPETGFLRLPQIVGDPKADPPVPALIPGGKLLLVAPFQIVEATLQLIPLDRIGASMLCLANLLELGRFDVRPPSDRSGGNCGRYCEAFARPIGRSRSWREGQKANPFPCLS